MAKTGVPTIQIDFDELDKLLFIQCTQSECAYFFGCSEDTITRRVQEEKGVTFAEYKAQKGARGRISLRRKQFEMAMKGNTTMMVWLGKNILRQTDKVEEVPAGYSETEVDMGMWDLKDPSLEIKGLP